MGVIYGGDGWFCGSSYFWWVGVGKEVFGLIFGWLIRFISIFCFFASSFRGFGLILGFYFGILGRWWWWLASYGWWWIDFELDCSGFG